MKCGQCYLPRSPHGILTGSKISSNISTLFQFVCKLCQNVLNKLDIVFSLRKHPELFFFKWKEKVSDIDQIQINSVKWLFLILSHKSNAEARKQVFTFTSDLRKMNKFFQVLRHCSSAPNLLSPYPCMPLSVRIIQRNQFFSIFFNVLP